MNIIRTVSNFIMRFGQRASSFIFTSGGGRPLNLNEFREAEVAAKNSAAVATVKWIQRNLTEAPITVGRLDKNDLVKQIESPLQELLEFPNNFYDGEALLKAVVADYLYTGNGYVIKIRSKEEGGVDARGRVVALWWTPSFTMTPLADPDDPTVYIRAYEYSVNNDKHFLDPRDVIHFRNGFDPNNIRLGKSEFASLLLEIVSDNEAGMWSWALLKNQGVPGVIISPEKETEILPEDAEKIKNDYIQKVSGSQRGMPIVLTAPVKIMSPSLDPKKMDLRENRKVNEERITAVAGIPAVVVGLGAGLEHSTFANFTEAREAAYENCMISLQKSLAGTLNQSLLPEFHNRKRYRVYFDISKVRVLQPDINALHVRARGDLLSGGISLNEYRKQIGQEPVDGGDTIWFVPNGVTVSQTPGVSVAPTDTGSVQDDINGNPQGGAPTTEMANGKVHAGN